MYSIKWARIDARRSMLRRVNVQPVPGQIVTLRVRLSAEEIKKNPDLPEYKSWTAGKSRLDTNIEAAYRALKK